MKGDIIMDPIDINRITKECYEELYAHKVDNLVKMDQFLKRCNLPQFTHEDI